MRYTIALFKPVLHIRKRKKEIVDKPNGKVKF
jgi:hypothetical protein